MLALAACSTGHPTAPSGGGGTTGGGTAPLVTVNTATTLATISPTVLGLNMATWYDITQPGIATAIHSAGFEAVRWPGGSSSDLYHWHTNTDCAGGYASPNSTFDHFMQDVAQPADLDVAITLDYGTDTTCAGPGNPAEAAAWVAYANTTKSYGVKWWTVGNEVYGNWETDLHAQPNDSVTYAAAVKSGYYPAIKAKDASAMVGVVVNPPSAWDHTVLGTAPYDFVEMHYYPEAPGAESDTLLIRDSPLLLRSALVSLKSELSAAGHPSTPIYVGEMGSVYTNPGKQSMSITQALFASEVIGELLDAGVARATWWLGYGGCSTGGGANYSSALYGFQNYGGYDLYADGGSGCGGTAANTPFPTVRAYQVAAVLAHAGERMLPVTVSSTLPLVRAYAASQGSGYAVMLINLDESNSASVPVGFSTLARGSAVTTVTYGKAQYDESQSGQWVGPVMASSGAWQKSAVVTLPPWSITVAVVTP